MVFLVFYQPSPLEFCQAREISTEGMTLNLSYDWDEKKLTCERLSIDLKLPFGFPDKYRKAVIRVMDLCSVKKHILKPPEFVMTATNSQSITPKA
jgi:hypothetical protein